MQLPNPSFVLIQTWLSQSFGIKPLDEGSQSLSLAFCQSLYLSDNNKFTLQTLTMAKAGPCQSQELCLNLSHWCRGWSTWTIFCCFVRHINVEQPGLQPTYGIQVEAYLAQPQWLPQYIIYIYIYTHTHTYMYENYKIKEIRKMERYPEFIHRKI